MSLKEATALNFWSCKNSGDIMSTLDIYKDEFCDHFLRLFHQVKIWSEQKPMEIGLNNYTLFRNTFPNSKPVTFNTKNITFETNGNLWERFKFYLSNKRAKGINPDLTINPNQPKVLSDIIKSNIFQSVGDPFNTICNIDSIPLYAENEYENFFGPGEFPVLVMSVVRIGNQDYSFWDISR